MKRYLLATALCALALPAYAQTVDPAPVDDPLHLCYTTGCSALGGVTVSTLGGSGLTGFGVSSSPAPQTGTLYFALLVPDNETETILPTLTGTLNGNPIAGIGSLIPEGTFASGTDLNANGGILAALGGSFTPPNPFSAYSGATLLEDPSFDGLDYSVFLVRVGTITTGAQAGQTPTLDNSFTLAGGDYLSGLNTLTGVGPGAIITAFMVETGVDHQGNPTLDVVSTAQSSSLLVQTTSAPPVPEPSTWAMFIAGFGLMGLLGLRKRRVPRFAV